MILSENPKEELARIYNKYVNHSDYTKERREDVLARELKRSIDRIDGLKNVFKQATIDGYFAKFSMPLVAKKHDRIQCAIKQKKTCFHLMTFYSQLKLLNHQTQAKAKLLTS